MNERTHASRTVHAPWEQDVEIDLFLVPLITELWARGYRTTYSCQGVVAAEATETRLEQPAYVSFAGVDQAERAAEALGLVLSGAFETALFPDGVGLIGCTDEPTVPYAERYAWKSGSTLRLPTLTAPWGRQA